MIITMNVRPLPLSIPIRRHLLFLSRKTIAGNVCVKQRGILNFTTHANMRRAVPGYQLNEKGTRRQITWSRQKLVPLAMSSFAEQPIPTSWCQIWLPETTYNSLSPNFGFQPSKFHVSASHMPLLYASGVITQDLNQSMFGLFGLFTTFGWEGSAVDKGHCI